MTEKGIQKKGALGKGIHSLLGDFELSETTSRQFAKSDPVSDIGSPQQKFKDTLPIEHIEPNPHQPRRFFDEKKLLELAQSLKLDGILQPLIVTPLEEDPSRYMIVAGERRYRAAKLAGIKDIPVIVKSGVQSDVLRLALIENIQRADLNIIEEAQAYEALVRDYGLTQEQCADRVGKDRSTVANALRVLALPKEIQDDLVEERLTMGHGRAILALEDKKTMLRVRDLVIKKGLNVRQTEQLVKNYKSGAVANVNKLPKNKADLDYLAESLRSHLKTKVRLSGNGHKGKIEISYFSAAELERLIAIIGQPI